MFFLPFADIRPDSSEVYPHMLIQHSAGRRKKGSGIFRHTDTKVKILQYLTYFSKVPFSGTSAQGYLQCFCCPVTVYKFIAGVYLSMRTSALELGLSTTKPPPSNQNGQPSPLVNKSSLATEHQLSTYGMGKHQAAEPRLSKRGVSTEGLQPPAI